MVGGEHERWEVPSRVDAEDELGWEGDDGRPKSQHGEAPKVWCRVAKRVMGRFQGSRVTVQAHVDL